MDSTIKSITNYSFLEDYVKSQYNKNFDFYKNATDEDWNDFVSFVANRKPKETYLESGKVDLYTAKSFIKHVYEYFFEKELLKIKPQLIKVIFCAKELEKTRLKNLDLTVLYSNIVNSRHYKNYNITQKSLLILASSSNNIFKFTIYDIEKFFLEKNKNKYKDKNIDFSIFRTGCKINISGSLVKTTPSFKNFKNNILNGIKFYNVLNRVTINSVEHPVLGKVM